MLTDMEIYNCKDLTSLPMNMLTELPELQMLNVACNQNITGEKPAGKLGRVYRRKEW